MQKPHIYHANHEHLTLHTPVGMKKHTQIYVLIYTVVHLFKLLMTSLFVEHTPNTLIVVAVRTRHCYVVLHTTADRCSIPFRVYTRSYHFIIGHNFLLLANGFTWSSNTHFLKWIRSCLAVPNTPESSLSVRKLQKTEDRKRMWPVKSSYFSHSREFRFTKIHLGVLRYKLLKHFVLLLFFRRRQAHCLLPLIVHHFLNHSSGFPIEIWQLWITRRNLLRVDERISEYQVGPPFHFIHLKLTEEEIRLDWVGRPAYANDKDIYNTRIISLFIEQTHQPQ